MEIIGRGFIARNLEAIAGAHPTTTVLAAGVSRTTATSESDFIRERLLVEDTIRRCTATGRRLVFLSTASSGVYGSPECSGREDSALVPSSPYAQHKLSLERLLLASDMDCLVLRLSHLVGRYQQAWQLMPSLVAQITAGTVTVRRGAQRDLLEIGDMIRITDLLLRLDITREVVNVASGTAVPIERIIEHVEQRLGITAVHQIVDVVDRSFTSIDKLRGLVPEVERMGFGPGYYRTVLDTYLRLPSTSR